MEETENPPEQIKDKQLETHARILESLDRHYVSLNNLLDRINRPLKLDDSNLHNLVDGLRGVLFPLINAVKSLDTIKTVAEIKYIGKRLTSIEKDIASMKREGIKKNVQLEFSVDGYELVKKRLNCDKLDEEEEIDDSNKSLRDLLQQLTKRQGEVLILRYGLFGEKKKTLEQTGKQLKITRERIRQIECKALRKCRDPVRKPFVDKITHKELKRDIIGEEN